MYSHIFLSVGLVIAAMIFASASYKSYEEIQEAKQIEETYTIVSQIKSLLAEQYNKNIKEITRDEIIAHLPSGDYWEKVLLINRDPNSTLAKDEFINEDGDMVISTDEKIKLLTLRNRLKRIKDLDAYTADTNKNIIYDVWADNQTNVYKDNIINKTIEKVTNIVYIDNGVSDLKTILNNYTPYNAIYQNMLESKDETISSDELKTRKQTYFKERLQEKLKLSKNTKDMAVYNLVKGL
ncbi:MAG: hypothetical protein ACNI28_09715 [Arcobacter sp.]|uniref:hypothetical protein n=1 Tax=Arcobacter sp. TaxID=1872629 RepID=UPI003B0053B7